jgi:tetratricopeptide (TPR) repeat protein
MSNFDELLRKLQNAESESAREWIALSFNLDTQAEIIREALSAASIPHWFNLSMLNSLVDSKLTEESFQELTNLPYVEEFPGYGWNIHEKTRLLLITDLISKDKNKFKIYSRKAASWCRKFYSAKMEWRAEACYLSLLSEERSSLETFIQTAANWLNQGQFTLVEALTRNILDAADNQWLSEKPAAWAWYFYGRVSSIFGKHSEANKHFARALSLSGNDKILKARATEHIGSMYIALSRLEKAEEYSNKALSLHRDLKSVSGEANCLLDLAMISAHSARYAEAKKLFLTAQKKYRDVKNHNGEANCKSGLADLLRILGEPELARTYCEQAL